MKRVTLKEINSGKQINFFRSLISSVTIGSLLVDTNRIISDCNNVIRRIFGYAPEEILGRRTDLLYGDRRINKQDKNEIFNWLEENGFHVGMAKGTTKGGRGVDLRLFTFVIRPNKGAIVLVKEVKKEGKTPKVNKERFLQDLLDNIPDMIYFKDMNNRFALVNKAHASALNLAPDEVAGKNDLELFSKDIAEKYFVDDNSVIKTGKPIMGKIEKALRPDGGITYVSTTKIPHYDEEGRIIGTIGITRNITDKMIAEEELRNYKDNLEELVRERTRQLEEGNEKLLRMYNVKSDFTSMVSHELRTPLATIKEGVGMVEDGTTGSLNGQQKKCLKAVLRNIDRLKRLIDDILDFSKFEQKKMKFKSVKGNLNEVISQVLKGYDVLLERKGLKLVMDLDPSLPLVNFDADRITQVLHNLINNAINYTNEGHIEVESKVEDRAVKVSIRDTGCGIKREDLHRVFERFEQVGAEAMPRKGSTGLGLAICKQIVEQLGGRIFVESEYEKGSEFFFILPVE